MAAPEDEVAALQRRLVAALDRHAEHLLLQVGVARRASAGRHQRQLHQRRAIEAEARAAAPEIGRLDETLGDSDEIGLGRRVDRPDMGGDDAPPPARWR